MIKRIAYRFLDMTYTTCVRLGVSPMIAVLPFMIVVWFASYFTLKGFVWLITWGL